MTALPLFARLAAQPSLRPYQVAAVAGIEERHAEGDRATLLVLATGLGKTVVFSEVCRRVVAAGGRALVLAHRTELLEQAADKLMALGLDVGLEQAENRAGRHSVVVASVQTLQGARLRRWSPDHFDLVVVDEAHHATARTYRRILKHFASARVLGVTATPDRGDGAALGRVFSSVAFDYDIRQGIADGWLSPIRAQRVHVDGLDLSAVRATAGDLNQGDLDLAMRAPEAVDGVAEPLVRLAGERPTLLFTVTVEHAYALAAAVNLLAPGTAAALDGSATREKRTRVLDAYRAGEIRVLVNCALFTEGFDAPDTSCVAIARPTKSRALYAQMIGRGTRLAPGKADCLVLDFAGLAGKHRLIGPADVLAGEPLDDDERAAAEAALAGADSDVLEAIAVAKAKVRAEREARRIAWHSSTVDLFGADALEEGVRKDWVGLPPLPEQVEYLSRKGLGSATLDRAQAGSLERALRLRQAQGLCSFKQARILARHGIAVRELSFSSASQLITELQAAGWRRPPSWAERAPHNQIGD